VPRSLKGHLCPPRAKPLTSDRNSLSTLSLTPIRFATFSWRSLSLNPTVSSQAYVTGASGRKVDRHVGLTCERLLSTAWRAWLHAVDARLRKSKLAAVRTRLKSPC
jgi:hypothetical protein